MKSRGILLNLISKCCAEGPRIECVIHLDTMVNTTVMTTRQNLIRSIVNEIVTDAKYRVYVGYDQITPKLTCVVVSNFMNNPEKRNGT